MSDHSSRKREASQQPCGIIYLSRISYPSRKAHAVQVLKTCHALAGEGAATTLLVEGQPAGGLAEVLEQNGLPAQAHLRLQTVPARTRFGSGWRTITFAIYLRRLSREVGPQTVFYTRNYRLAERYLRVRPMVRRPLLFETHKKEGYNKEEGMEGLPLSPLRQEQQQRGETRRQIESIYRRADGLCSLTAGTLAALKRDGIQTPAEFLWYGCDVQHAPADPASGEGVLYVGNPYAHKGVELLVQAMTKVPDEPLFIAGGDRREDLARLGEAALTAGLEGRLKLLGYIPHRDVAALIREAKVCVLLSEGIKLSEYMALGAAVVGPAFPSVEEHLQDGTTGLTFRPDDVDSLAATIRRAISDRELRRRIGQGAREHAESFTWPRRAQIILNLAERCIS